MATSNHKKQYTTLSDIDHVLLRPEVIIGSTVPMEQQNMLLMKLFRNLREQVLFLKLL